MLIFQSRPLRGGVPAVPEQSNEDGIVPPVKVLRKRLNGVYRADGFSGPTRRYVLIVALLVGLASLPTLAAITAGSTELDDGTTGAMDVPFLPPPASGPVVPVPVLPAPSKMPAAAGERQSRSPRPSGTARSRTPGRSDRRPPSSRVSAGTPSSADGSRAPARTGAGRPAESATEPSGAGAPKPAPTGHAQPP